MTSGFPRKTTVCPYCGRVITPADNKCPYDLTPNPYYKKATRGVKR